MKNLPWFKIAIGGFIVVMLIKFGKFITGMLSGKSPEEQKIEKQLESNLSNVVTKVALMSKSPAMIDSIVAQHYSIMTSWNPFDWYQGWDIIWRTTKTCNAQDLLYMVKSFGFRDYGPFFLPSKSLGLLGWYEHTLSETELTLLKPRQP
jgi:hypothetical protein